MTGTGEIDPDQPSFIRYRLDEKDSSGYRYLGLGTKYDTFLAFFIQFMMGSKGRLNLNLF